MNEQEIKELAVPLARIILSFYGDPKNEEAFQKWKAKQKQS